MVCGGGAALLFCRSEQRERIVLNICPCDRNCCKGKHAQLTKRLELLAIEQFGSDENEEEIPSKRRRITEKVYEKEAEEIPSAKAPSQKAMVKRHEKARTVATLDALDKEKDDPACKEVCSQCLEHKIVIARQEGEIRRLKETNVAKESMAYCAQQVEICTQQMQLQVAESQKQLAKVVEGVGQRRAESSVLRDQLSTQTALRPAVRDAPSPVRTQDQVETIQQPAVDRAVRPNARSLPVPANVGPADMEDAVTISPNIRVPKRRYQTMDWTQPKKAIRDMLVAVFTRSTLAVSSLTGGRSNANSGNDVVPRPALDPVLLHELIAFLSIKIKMEKNAIRTIMRGKINDEVKMKRIADVKRLLQETQPQNRQQNNGAERQADSDDDPKIIYYIFYLLGMGTLLPWNFFITADSYWQYKFRNATVDMSSAVGADTTTKLQYNFTAYLAVASMLPNTTFLTLNAIFAHKINQQLKLVVALSLVIVFFIVTTILVPINSDDWQYSFFALTMAVVVILNVGSAVFQGGLFGLSAQFPSKYLSAVLSGQALGAVFACLCRIVSIAVAGEDAVAAAVNSALVYFTLADITLLISMAAFLWVTKTTFYRFYTTTPSSGSASSNRSITTAVVSKRPSINVWQVFLKIKWYALSVTLVFVVTLAMFPAITAKIQPVSYKGTIWARDYFGPVCCFLLFNLTDYIGRIAGGYTVWPKKQHWYFVLLMVVLRVVFVPLFMYCNIAHNHLTTVFNHDAYYIIFMLIFGLSNGYLATLCMIYGPGCVEPEEQNTASSMMAAFLGLGLCLGAVFSNLTIEII